MSSPASKGGVKALRFAVLVSLAGLGVAAFLVVGSYLYWQSEKSATVVSQRTLQEQRNRLESIKRERDDLQGSEETYKNLISSGAFAPERRLDLVEAMTTLRQRHRLIGLEYEVFPQRPLKFGSGATYAAVDIMASRMRLKVLAYHDGDLLAFLDEFPRIQRGFFPIDRCLIKRTLPSLSGTLTPVAGVAASTAAAPGSALANSAVSTAAIEADCTLEWITLVDKRAPPVLQARDPANPAAVPGRPS